MGQVNANTERIIAFEQNSKAKFETLNLQIEKLDQPASHEMLYAQIRAKLERQSSQLEMLVRNLESKDQSSPREVTQQDLKASLIAEVKSTTISELRMQRNGLWSEDTPNWRTPLSENDGSSLEDNIGFQPDVSQQQT